MQAKPHKDKYFALSKYVEAVLKKAEYDKDERDVIIARVPKASGFFAQEILLRKRELIYKMVN